MDERAAQRRTRLTTRIVILFKRLKHFTRLIVSVHWDPCDSDFGRFSTIRAIHRRVARALIGEVSARVNANGNSDWVYARRQGLAGALCGLYLCKQTAQYKPSPAALGYRNS